MAINSKIEWTDHTVNFWHGCTKVSPLCDNCYAEAFSRRVGRDIWGPGKPRMLVKSAFNNLGAIVRGAEKFMQEHGRQQRVFVQSMSDTFDNEVPDEWRDKVFAAIEAADCVEFQMVTKRLPNVEKMIPTKWRSFWPKHVTLIISVGNQEEADRDVPRLLKLKRLFGIHRVGLSCEPLLGPINLLRVNEDLDGFDDALTRSDAYPLTPVLDWIIVGGESGPGFRPMQIEWADDLRAQCTAAGVPFFFKQDSGRLPGNRGRASDALWSCKQFPA